MIIAITVPLFFPEWIGGMEVATYMLAKKLADRGHDVHVLTLKGREQGGKCREGDFQVHRLPCRRIKFIGTALFWLRLFLEIRKVDPDIVHVQSIQIGIPALLSKKVLGKPYIVWGRGSDVYRPWAFKKTISRLVLQNADSAIALTKDMKGAMEKLGGWKIQVIPNGIELGRFNARRGSRGDGRSVLYVGTLRSVKGVKYLVEAMEFIKKRGLDAMLTIVGDGPEREDLERLVREKNLGGYVLFRDSVPNEEVPDYMAASDVFVLPSLSEGFPNTVLEAMASGLPVVASNVGGLPEIVVHGKNGFLVEPERPVELAERICLLLEDTGMRSKMAETNMKAAEAYGWDEIVDRLESLYHSQINK